MTLAETDIERQVALAMALPDDPPETAGIVEVEAEAPAAPGCAQVLLVTQTPAIRDALSAEMAQDDTVQGQTRPGPLSAALPELAGAPGNIDVLVFELDRELEADLAALRALTETPGPQLIAVSATPLCETRKQVLENAGVQEVLSLTLTAQSGARDVQKLPEPAETIPAETIPPETIPAARDLPPPNAPQGKPIRLPQSGPLNALAAAQPVRSDITVVLRARGGAGATTIAVNLAVTEAEHVAPGSIALVDLDLQNGAMALSRDMPDCTDTSEQGKGETDVDDDFLARAMVRHHSGVDVLTAPDVFAPLTALQPGRIAQLLDALQARYDHVVLDMPQSVLDWIEPVLDRAARVLLVSDMSLPSIKRTRRLVDIIGENRTALPIRVVINLDRKSTFPSATQAEIAELIGAPLAHWIPVDPRAARRVGNGTRAAPPLADAKPSATGKAFGALVKAISPRQKKG
ncbi:CpaE family protein [Sulfitobacter aestuarii]|uniref:CpaE family protein n=1 Tax=Sulfitobacter aestuarii TaxID=2161676 RepID=A0ABW5U3F9_9RHOB